MKITANMAGREKQQVLALFFIGFVLGIVLCNIWLGNVVDNGGIMSSWFLAQFSYAEIEFSQLFWYVLEKRVKTFCVLVIMGFTSAGNILLMGCLLWCGICLGSFFSMCIIQMGILGVLLAVCSLFPQVIMYVPLFFMLLKLTGNPIKFSAVKCGKKQKNGIYAVLGILSVVVLLTGICMESYLNPILLKQLLQWL